jgi:glycine/D-amino acid oxidase-like deaminating enzyme
MKIEDSYHRQDGVQQPYSGTRPQQNFMTMEGRARILVGPPIANPLHSYWQHPKSPLAAVIEPECLSPTQPYDYVIVGSGISGTMVAYNIFKTNPSARVVVIDAREISSGATGRNGGHTKAASYRTYLQHKEELGKEEALRIARLEYANIIETHALAKELEIECENQACNTVDIIYDPQTFEQGRKAIEELEADSNEEERRPGKMASYRIYHANEGIEQKFWVDNANSNPAVENEKVAGAFEYLAGKIHAYRFTTGVLKHLVQRHALQLCANTPVHAFLPSPSSTPEIPLWDVFTQRTTIPTRNVILATNGYTPYLLPTLQGAIVPLRGQILAQKPPPTARHPSVLPKTYSFIYASGYEYMIPRQLPDGGQHIVIGGGLGRLPNAGAAEYGTVDDSALNTDVSAYLDGTVAGYFGLPTSSSPSAQDAPEYELVHEWTGIMGATADGRPFVGEIPGKKGVWVSAGFNGHGMVLCLKAAEGLVGMIGGGRGAERLEWFPKSFVISEERITKANFGGRADMKVPETGRGPVGGGGS